MKEWAWKTSEDTLTLECLRQSQHNVHMKSDTMFLAGLGLPPTKLVPSQTGVDAICKKCTEAVRMGSQSSILELCTSSVSGLESSPIPPTQQSSILDFNRPLVT